MLNTLLLAIWMVQGPVTGQVVENGEGLPFCHVCFTQDSCIVTDINGRFRISSDYINEQSTLEVKYVGYETRVIEVNASDLGKINLTPSITQLESLYITAETPAEIFSKAVDQMAELVHAKPDSRTYHMTEEIIIDSTNRFSRVDKKWLGDGRFTLQKETGGYDVDLTNLISNQNPALSYFDLIQLSQSHLDPANVVDYHFEIVGYHDQGYFIRQTVKGGDYIQYIYRINLDDYLIQDFDFTWKFEEPSQRHYTNRELQVKNYLWKGRASYNHKGDAPYALDYIQIWRRGYFRKSFSDRKHSVHHLSYAVLEE